MLIDSMIKSLVYKALYIYIYILLNGCLAGDSNKFYKYVMLDGDIERYQVGEYTTEIEKSFHNRDKKQVKYCIHFLSFFLPINFWDITITPAQDVKHTLSKLNIQNAQGMENVSIAGMVVLSPFYSFNCTTVRGYVIYDDEELKQKNHD